MFFCVFLCRNQFLSVKLTETLVNHFLSHFNIIYFVASSYNFPFTVLYAKLPLPDHKNAPSPEVLLDLLRTIR